MCEAAHGRIVTDGVEEPLRQRDRKKVGVVTDPFASTPRLVSIADFFVGATFS
jgi:hypothetical protein